MDTVNSPESTSLKARSPVRCATASAGSLFFRLSPEIRNQIYDILLRWPDSHTLYSHYNHQIKQYYIRKTQGYEEEFPVYRSRLRTPTILLLCRAITSECLGILKSRRLVIDLLPPWLPGAERPMRISQFIGVRTLQTLQFIEIHLSLCHGRFGSGWVWSTIVAELVDILLHQNAFKEFRVVIGVSLVDGARLLLEECRHYGAIQDKIAQLSEQNPSVWTPGKIEQETWVVKERVAYKAGADDVPDGMFTHGFPSVLYENGPGKVQETRTYPDEYIWRGSLLEFL